MTALISAIAREREVNESKTLIVRGSFALLLLALLLLVVQASILGLER